MSVPVLESSQNNLQIIDTTENTKLYSVKDKKILVKQIEKLSKLEHIEVYKIIRNDTNHFTENINGIFVNFAILNDNTIKKIKNYVDYCTKKKYELRIKENKMNDDRFKIFGKEDKSFHNKFVENEKKFTKGIITNKIIHKKKIDDAYELEISSDDSDNMIEKITLKKKKVKYSGLKAKIIKNYKDTCRKKTSKIVNKKIIKIRADELDKKILKLSRLSKDLENNS